MFARLEIGSLQRVYQRPRLEGVCAAALCPEKSSSLRHFSVSLYPKASVHEPSDLGALGVLVFTKMSSGNIALSMSDAEVHFGLNWVSVN